MLHPCPVCLAPVPFLSHSSQYCLTLCGFCPTHVVSASPHLHLCLIYFTSFLSLCQLYHFSFSCPILVPPISFLFHSSWLLSYSCFLSPLAIISVASILTLPYQLYHLLDYSCPIHARPVSLLLLLSPIPFNLSLPFLTFLSFSFFLTLFDLCQLYHLLDYSCPIYVRPDSLLHFYSALLTLLLPF